MSQFAVRAMLRTLVIGTIFLSITIALLALQPAPRSDRFVAPVLSEAPVAPVVEEITATRADTNLITAPVGIPAMPKPVAPKPIVAQVIAPNTPTSIKGLQELVTVALTQGMTGQEIDDHTSSRTWHNDHFGSNAYIRWAPRHNGDVSNTC
jgi:hypothetical protein